MLCTSVLGNWRYLEEYSITRVECGKNFPWYCESHGTLLWLWTMLCQSNLFVSICRVLTLTSVSKQWMSEPQSLPLVIVGIIPFATKKSFSAWGKNKFRNTCSWVNHTCTKTKWPPTINMGFRTQGGGTAHGVLTFPRCGLQYTKTPTNDCNVGPLHPRLSLPKNACWISPVLVKGVHWLLPPACVSMLLEWGHWFACPTSP